MSCSHLRANQLCPGHLRYCAVHLWERPPLARQKPFHSVKHLTEWYTPLKKCYQARKLGRLDSLMVLRLIISCSSAWQPTWKRLQHCIYTWCTQGKRSTQFNWRPQFKWRTRKPILLASHVMQKWYARFLSILTYSLNTIWRHHT